MGKLVDGLLEYLASTSEIQFAKDWADLEKYNEIGPEINSFIEQSCELDRFRIDDLISEVTLINNIENPDFIPDFFYL